MATATARIGDNRPPSDAEQILSALEFDSLPLLERRDELLGAVDRMPAEIADDEVAGKVTDLIKLIAACSKNAESERTATKEPHLQAGRVIDGFFKQITDPLATAKRTAETRLTNWQRKQAEFERRRREETERRAREEAERARQEAEAQAAAMETPEDLDAAVTAAALARQAEADAERAQQETTAKAADLSRQRGSMGSVASLRTFWDFTDLERSQIDLNGLRPYIPLDALEKAVRVFIKSGGRQLAGVRIFENTTSVVR